MACLDMYNSTEHNKQGHHHMSPRISFSNDFVDLQQAMKQERSSRSSSDSTSTTTTQVPAASDFEFSTTNYSMMSADELFSKGRLLPYKDKMMQNRATTTLKEELLVNDDDYDQGFSLRPPKGIIRWKGLLGLRKSHIIGSKKVDKISSTESGSQLRKGNEVGSSQLTFTSQEMMNEGSSG